MREEDLDKIIARNISDYLSESGRDQQDFADFMNVSQATISYWCKGNKLPRMNKIDQICSYFNISRSELFQDRRNVGAAYSFASENDSKALLEYLSKSKTVRNILAETKKLSEEDLKLIYKIMQRMEHAQHSAK